MALSGVHVCFGSSAIGLAAQAQSTLPYRARSSQTMAAAAVSTALAPLIGNAQPLLSVSASAAIYYATGQNVSLASLNVDGNGVGNRRYYDPTQTPGREDIFVNANDAFVWGLASNLGALAGVHICFGYTAIGVASLQPQPTLPFNAQSSQTMAAPGTSNIVAPGGMNGLQPLLSISALAAIFYATGENPDPTNGPRRYYDPTTSPGREDIFVKAGDKFAWIAA